MVRSTLLYHTSLDTTHTTHTTHHMKNGCPKSWTFWGTGPGPRKPQPAAKPADGFRPLRAPNPGKPGDGFRPGIPALSLSKPKGKGRNLGPEIRPRLAGGVGLSGAGIRVQFGPRDRASWGPVLRPRKPTFLGTDYDFNTTYTHTTTHQPVCRGWCVVCVVQYAVCCVLSAVCCGAWGVGPHTSHLTPTHHTHHAPHSSPEAVQSNPELA